MTGNYPFIQHRAEGAVLLAIYRGDRPPRPPNCKDWLWALIRQCWDTDPLKRPSMREVVEKIQGVKRRLDELMNELRM